MTDSKACQTIHSARRDAEGKRRCWHEWMYSEDTYKSHKEGKAQAVCKHCLLEFMAGKMPTNPSYTTDPVAYLEAMAEMQEREWWGDFKNWLWDMHKSNRASKIETIIDGILLNPHRGSHALAEWLDKNRKLWEEEV